MAEGDIDRRAAGRRQRGKRLAAIGKGIRVRLGVLHPVFIHPHDQSLTVAKGIHNGEPPVFVGGASAASHRLSPHQPVKGAQLPSPKQIVLPNPQVVAARAAADRLGVAGSIPGGVQLGESRHIEQELPISAIPGLDSLVGIIIGKVAEQHRGGGNQEDRQHRKAGAAQQPEPHPSGNPPCLRGGRRLLIRKLFVEPLGKIISNRLVLFNFGLNRRLAFGVGAPRLYLLQHLAKAHTHSSSNRFFSLDRARVRPVLTAPGLLPVSREISATGHRSK